ncbi:MAG: FtsW/RodA/SpoVE family cell cycle protein [Oscillospiraceae bacterium]|jgi:cell division protein FtsW|nr:FtsW/RodA/SpoVE family cell cycle protein [Oscillospiraceae bacterium]
MTEYGTFQNAPVLRDARRKPKTRADGVFLALTLMILLVGLVMLFSASYASSYYTSKDNNPYSVIVGQLFFTVLGLAAMFVISYLPEVVFYKISLPAFFISIGLLVAVLLFGSIGGGGRRWLDLAIVRFQPSEVAKFGVILMYAYIADKVSKSGSRYDKIKASAKYISSRKHTDRARSGRFEWLFPYYLRVDFSYTVLPYISILMVICVLLVAEPHVSACVIFILITGVMMFQSGTRYRFLVVLMALAAFAAYVMYKTGIPEDYVRERVIVWRDLWNPDNPIAVEKGYQVRQSLIAIGSGGFSGLGLGNSRQKHLYLPEEHNDFIFSVVCEELGFIGAVLILLLFALLIVRGYWLAWNAKSKFSMLVIGGVTTQLAVQVFLNVAVVTNLFPCTGISLPFFSSGGSALFTQMAAMGMVLALSRKAE